MAAASQSPTPDQALQRVLRLSRLNGWSVAVFAALCTLVTLLLGDLVGAFVGLVAIISGAMEVRGHRLLRRRDVNGVKWLVRAQLLLLGVILAYAASRIVSFDAGYLKEQVIPEMRQNLLPLGINFDEILQQFGLTVDNVVPLVQKVVWAFYGAVMLATCLYQGGLALYYRRCAPLVAQALAAPLSVPPALSSVAEPPPLPPLV